MHIFNLRVGLIILYFINIYIICQYYFLPFCTLTSPSSDCEWTDPLYSCARAVSDKRTTLYQLADTIFHKHYTLVYVTNVLTLCLM